VTFTVSVGFTNNRYRADIYLVSKLLCRISYNIYETAHYLPLPVVLVLDRVPVYLYRKHGRFHVIP
jgi:hypothetical protein